MVENHNTVLERYVAGIVYAILVIIILISNILLGVALKKNAFTYQPAFYKLLWNIIYINCLTACVYGLVVTPITFTLSNFYLGNPSYFLYRVLVCSEYVMFKGSVLQTLMMFVNRCTIFLAPTLNEQFFKGRTLRIIIALIWIFPICETLVQSATDCKKEFSIADLTFMYFCTVEDEKRVLFHKIDSYQRTSCPPLILLANLCLYIYIRMARQNGVRKQQGNTESILLYQGTFICIVQSINGIIFNHFGFLFAPDENGHTSLFLPLLLNCCSLLRAVADPIICVRFNAQIRAALLGMFGKQRAPKLVSTVSNTNINKGTPRGR